MQDGRNGRFASGVCLTRGQSRSKYWANAERMRCSATLIYDCRRNLSSPRRIFALKEWLDPP